LIRKNTCMSLWSFQGARGLEPAVPRRSHCRLQGRDQFARAWTGTARSLKTQQRDLVQAALRRLALPSRGRHWFQASPVSGRTRDRINPVPTHRRTGRLPG